MSKTRVNKKKTRLFASFKDIEQYNYYRDMTFRAIPNRYHWDIEVLLQGVISTYIEKPCVAKDIFK
jgi:hypothetical protein